MVHTFLEVFKTCYFLKIFTTDEFHRNIFIELAVLPTTHQNWPHDPPVGSDS